MAYTKEFLIDAFLSRYELANLGGPRLAEITYELYDRVGRDKFREYCSLTPDRLREYQNWLDQHGYKNLYLS
jgi:hypothetical protein